MKVCHITSLHSYKDVRITIKEAKTLNGSGLTVYLIAPNTENLIYEGIKVIGVKRKQQNKLLRVINASKEFYKAAIELDAEVYHFHDPELIPLGKKLSKIGKKVIYDVHEDVPRQILEKSWIPKMFRNIISWMFDKYEKNSVRSFDAVVTATPYITEMFGQSNNNIIDIKNYPKLEELTFEQNEFKKQKQFIYVGGISTNRGIVNMIKAIESVPNGSLALAGFFSSSDLQVKSVQLNGWKKVNYEGFVDREGIKNLLGESIAGLVILRPTINYKDSLPIKMFEYMAAGIPVIASNFPLWKKIIEENECGICVDPLDVSETSKAMNYIINNPKIADKMGQNGRRAVETEYNWEAESEKLLKLYKNL